MLELLFQFSRLHNSIPDLAEVLERGGIHKHVVSIAFLQIDDLREHLADLDLRIRAVAVLAPESPLSKRLTDGAAALLPSEVQRLPTGRSIQFTVRSEWHRDSCDGGTREERHWVVEGCIFQWLN